MSGQLHHATWSRFQASNEEHEWALAGGDELEIFDTDEGGIGILS